MLSITQLILKDPKRLRLLKLLASLDLKDAYIAAGFVRNMVWDELHQKTESTPLNDVDVVFFDESDLDNNLAKVVQARLKNLDNTVFWQVKNQAHMHIKNQDKPYLSTVHAMRYWPEKETAIGVRINQFQEIEVLAPFGTHSLYKGVISHNPNRDKAVFLERVSNKGWLDIWPKLRIEAE